MGIGLIVLGAKWGNINLATFIPLVAAVPVAFTLCASDINHNVRKFKKEHKGFKFPTNAFKLDNSREKSLALVKKKAKNDYIEKCEVAKKEVSSPVYADLYCKTVEQEKVKVKVKKK